MRTRTVTVIILIVVVLIAAVLLVVGLEQVEQCDDTGDAATSQCETSWQWSLW